LIEADAANRQRNPEESQQEQRRRYKKRLQELKGLKKERSDSTLVEETSEGNTKERYRNTGSTINRIRRKLKQRKKDLDE